MLMFFLVVLIIVSVALGLFVLVQNPKGGGLAGSLGGFGNQFMGVKQTTDILEKGTWVLASIVALLCLFSPVFLKSKSKSLLDSAPQNNPVKQVTPVQPQQTAPTLNPADTPKK